MLEASIMVYVYLIYFILGILGDNSNHPYKERHPMKPHRLTLTNALIMGYGLDKQIHHIYDPRPATKEELENYHDSDYIDFLSRFVNPAFRIMPQPLELLLKTKVP
jgi:acetoin utilization deacetylase AcuC-like enzyme